MFQQRTRRRSLALLVALGMTLGSWATGPVAATPGYQPATNEAIQLAAAERAVYGLRADEAFVRSLRTSGADVGSARVGIVLTQAELAQLDLPERARMADVAQARIRPLAEQQPGYAGIYQDQTNGGRIVARFTTDSQVARAALRAAAADVPLVIDDSARSTFSAMRAAADDLLRRQRTLLPGVAVLSVSVDEVQNRLQVGVSADSLVRARADAAALSRAIGIDLEMVETIVPEVQAQVCEAAGRSFCFDPMRAGTLVFNNQPNAGQCTMGFHVQKRSNTNTKGFMLSGHCSFASGKNWYMERYLGPVGNGFIGGVAATRYKDVGEDCMIVNMPKIQASRQIYDTARNVGGSGNPIQNETIWISPGKTDDVVGTGVDSGFVKAATISYLDFFPDPDGWIMHGADADNFATRAGDSGSPIYRDTGGAAIAVGVHADALGRFAKMQDCLNLMAWSVH